LIFTIKLKDLIMKDIYTPIEIAAELLEENRQNTENRERVAQYLGNILPSNCLELEQPVAILARYVSRATAEDIIFADISQDAGFVPYWSTYKSDKFTTRNPEKVETIRPPIKWAKGQRTRSWVVEQDKRMGGVGELDTIFDCSSSAFQQGIRELVFSRRGMTGLVKNQFDMAEWYKFQAQRFGYNCGNLAPYYYPATMALATTFCALFEDFDGGPNANNGDLSVFKNNVVYPAIAKVRKELGLKPVIVRLPFQPGMNETDLTFLDSYQMEQFRLYGSLILKSDKLGAYDAT